MADTMVEWVSNLLTTMPPTPVKYDMNRGVILEMKAQPHSWWCAMDSSLILKEGCQNHTLTLVLKIFFNPILPHTVPKELRVPWFESINPPEVFQMMPWEAGQWARFLKDVKTQCAKWNNNFWLVPPAGFSKLDTKVGSRSFRPNVYCHLYVELLTNAAGAYSTINVINLDPANLVAQGYDPKKLNSGVSRSQSDRYDNMDVKTRPTSRPDDMGRTVAVKNYSTVVHEIGHAIGLPHIGVTHQDPHCKISLLLDKHLPKGTSVPALYTGGPNANACYGHHAKAVRGKNVMGGGVDFEASNAAPWAKRLSLHTHTKPEEWTVVLKEPPAPKPL